MQPPYDHNHDGPLLHVIKKVHGTCISIYILKTAENNCKNYYTIHVVTGVYKQ